MPPSCQHATVLTPVPASNKVRMSPFPEDGTDDAAMWKEETPKVNVGKAQESGTKFEPDYRVDARLDWTMEVVGGQWRGGW